MIDPSSEERKYLFRRQAGTGRLHQVCPQSGCVWVTVGNFTLRLRAFVRVGGRWVGLGLSIGAVG